MIRVSEIKIPIEKDSQEELERKIFHLYPLLKNNSYQIVKKSIDARDKSNIFYVYQVDFNCLNEENILRKYKKLSKSNVISYHYVGKGEKKLDNSILVVGSGPCGLFCAYKLAKDGYHPIVLERGEEMEKRIQSVENFFQTNKLNSSSNIQFGEGGAGTFSDGKLNTLVKDKSGRMREVFRIFVENGAPEDILYLQNPHIGTDLLRKVIVNIRNKIIEWGGEFHYSSFMSDIIIENNKVKAVEVNYQDIIPCSCLVLAIGHSARDTFSLLAEKNIKMVPKNFAVGVRIMHPQKMISESQYGSKYNLLPPASYKLVYHATNGRGVYSFCMCPGGYVVNASSEDGLLAINGMSNYKRDAENANSAIVVTVSEKDFSDGLMGGVAFQRMLEEKAYEIGNGVIPIQLLEDFMNDRVSTHFKSVFPVTKGKVSFANLNVLFSKDICDALKEAIPYFGKKIKGFDRGDALLLGVESRTSSPIRILRDEGFEANIKGLYPGGEGAGYAGGITTSAMDGIKIAEKIEDIYQRVGDNYE